MRALTNPLRASEPDLGPLFPGLYAGHVSAVADQDKLGKIKVSVPAVFGGDGPEYDAWARPCFPYGHFMVPEVGDRVWVAFQDGDPAAPVWLGVWYPTGAAPTDGANASPPVKRVVRTPSGHELLLDDTQNAGKVQLASGGGNTLLLDDASGAVKVHIQDAHGSVVELKSTGMTITAAGSLTIHADQALTIEAPGQAITIKAASVDVQSG